MDNKVDVFIACVYKDMNKLKFLLPSILKYIKELNNIYISMPDKMDLPNYKYYGHEVRIFNDFEVLPNVDLSKCRFRKNWIFQQLLKLLQRKTQTEYNLIVDADLVFVDDFPLFKNNKPIQFIGEWEHFIPYFNFFDKLTNGDIKRDVDECFIADLGFFKNSIIDEMIKRYGYTRESFIDFVLTNTFWDGHMETGSMISEYELFGHYCHKYHNGEFEMVRTKAKNIKRMQYDQNEQIFSDSEIQKEIDTIDKTKYNIVKFNSGCCATNINYKR